MTGVRVDFALLLFDEFSGELVRDAGVQFWYLGRRLTPVRKKEGFYVFQGLNQPAAELVIVCTHYHQKRVTIEKDGLDPAYPLARVRLLRQHSSVFGDCEWLGGSGTPQSKVLALAEESGLRIGLLEPDGAGTKISLLGYATEKLLGRRVAQSPQGEESFILRQMRSPGVYYTDKAPLQPPRGSGPLYRVYLSQSGLDGSFAIPVDSGKSCKISSASCWDKESGQWVSVSAAALL